MKRSVLIMMSHFVDGHTKLLVQANPVSDRETSKGHSTTTCCTSQFKICSKHGSFSCFVCVHVFMSLMWFFYPRASSGTLSQESKCGTPVTASSSPICLLCMCVHACVCAHTDLYVEETTNPHRLCTFMYAWVCSWQHTLHMLVAQKDHSPHSPGLLFGEDGETVERI